LALREAPLHLDSHRRLAKLCSPSLASNHGRRPEYNPSDLQAASIDFLVMCPSSVI
jgi:hypothetical protein